MTTSTDAPAAAVRLSEVARTYGRGPAAVQALRTVSVDIPDGSFTAVMGPSGSGKSTLLQCAAGLDTPTSGSVRLGDTELTGMDENALTRLRRGRVGFVFQAYNLVPSLTVRQNVGLPLRLAGRREDRARIDSLLEKVGIAGKGWLRPAQLSGGEAQRAAVARALITAPDVVFADEPTGALDTVSAAGVLELLRRCVDDAHQTVVMVTHDPVAASYADAVLLLADGMIVDELVAPTAARVAERLSALGGRPGTAGRDGGRSR
ncbi:hypothetical protein BIV57_16830 [Mangrovactinospora gilvigrisea]|uniref:ABC transporter domain-containing protein n=1 Tax=Mangrovactinospora gilvigrisea TaxID=1428644 RepID=A0A1J7BCD5_9ACTN|nr:ABC transporter ATP-binding protein [Mangrovactinospora gilvigrisea]OIV36310.1 hypothetical protein BIV57_16830 [Mangrovactinospora gilvigrisea]